MSRPLTILGITTDGELAFHFGDTLDTEPLTLGEADLIELLGAIQRDYLPLWPTSPCAVCERDSVVTIEGADFCEGHAMSYGMAEDESQEAMK